VRERERSREIEREIEERSREREREGKRERWWGRERREVDVSTLLQMTRYRCM